MSAGWPTPDLANVLTPLAEIPSLVLKIAIPTALYLFFVVVVWFGRKKLLAALNRLMIERVQKLTTPRLHRVGLQPLLILSRFFVRLASVGLTLIATLVWLTALLETSERTQPWAHRIEGTVLSEITRLGEKALLSLPGLGIVALLFFVARVVHETMNRYFESVEKGEIESHTWDAITAQTTRRISGVVLWLATLIIAYPYIPGSETAAFKGVTILAGLMLSLGSTNLVGQLVNGLVLIYSRALRPGDTIVVESVEGVVEKLGLFTCTVRTSNDELVWLPNSALIAGVKNYSRPTENGCVRFTTQVTIGYDTPWQTVHRLLLAAAAEAWGVRKEPAPFIRQIALEDFYVRYELVFAPEMPSRRKLILSSVHEKIQSQFHSAGVQIMSPHYLSDPPREKIPPVPPK